MRIRSKCRNGEASSLSLSSIVLNCAAAFSSASILSDTSTRTTSRINEHRHITCHASSTRLVERASLDLSLSSTSAFASQTPHLMQVPVNQSSSTIQSDGRSEGKHDLALPTQYSSSTTGKVLGNPNSSYSPSKQDKGTQLFDDIKEDHRSASNQSVSHRPTKLKDSPSSSTITQVSYPAFVLPTGFPNNATTGCNAWGPLCQTGSTVVEVKDHGSIATTTVPCSSLLSAQAYTVRNDRSALSSWRSHFGRSPQCTAYADSVRSGDAGDAPAWLSSCGQAVSTMANVDIYPPGMDEKGGLNGTVNCCGLCAIFVPRVRLRYFPEDPDVPCGEPFYPSASSTITAAPNPADARTSLYVSDGFTYTSPSLYFEIMGTASFEDDCGQLGTKVVSSTLAIPPGVMSTVYFDVPIGADLPRGTRASKLRQKLPLKTRDLACPTWGVNLPVTAGRDQDIKIGYPFYPLLVPPPELLAIDPAWSKCFQNHWPLRFGIFDPPRALTANTFMVGSPAIQPTYLPESGSGNPSIPSPAPSELTPVPAAVVPFIPQATSGPGYFGQSSGSEQSDGLKEIKGGSLDNGMVYSPESQQNDAESPDSPLDLSNSGSSGDDDDGLAGVPNQNSNEGSDPNGGEAAAAHVMTIGALTYTESLHCSCYSLASGETLSPGGMLTMVDGTVISLAPNGASAIINGDTSRLSPVVTGIAPAFAEVLDAGQVPRSTSIDGGKASGASEEKSMSATVVPSFKAMMTMSDGNNLTPVTADSVTASNSAHIGAAIVTAFHMGAAGGTSEDAVQTFGTAAATADLGQSQPIRGTQNKLTIPWFWAILHTFACLSLLIF